MGQNMERLMKMADREYTGTKRVLEINPRHAIVKNMAALLKKDRNAQQLKDWAHLLVDYVLLGEGKVEDPQRVTRTLQGVMEAATGHFAEGE